MGTSGSSRLPVPSPIPNTEKVWGPRARRRWSKPLEGLPGRQGMGRHRDASGRQSSGRGGGDGGCPGGRGQSPAWHLPLQDGEWGEHRGQPRPRSQAPRPAKGRGDDRTRTPRHSPRARPQGRCSPSDPCEVAAASSPMGTGDRQGGHSDALRTELDSGRSVRGAPRREQPQPRGLWRRPGLPVTAAAWLIGRGGSGAGRLRGPSLGRRWKIPSLDHHPPERGQGPSGPGEKYLQITYLIGG